MRTWFFNFLIQQTQITVTARDLIVEDLFLYKVDYDGMSVVSLQ